MINHAVKAIVIDEEGRFLLQKRDISAGLAFGGCWNFFGGLTDTDEDPRDALIRELEEELSITIERPASELFTWEYRENWYTTINHYFLVTTQFEKDKLKLNEGAGMAWLHPHDFVTEELTPAVYENFSRVIHAIATRPSSNILHAVEESLMEKHGLFKKNERVYYAKQNPVAIPRQAMVLFREIAILKDLPVIRICLHDTDTSDVHEMIMVHAKPHNVGPLKQLKTSLSYHLLQGILEITLYDDSGKKAEHSYIVSADQHISGSVSSIRLNAATFRSVRNLSPTAIFLEVASGPFKDDDTIWLS